MKRACVYAGVGMILSVLAIVRADSQPLTIRAGKIIFDRPEFDSLVLVEFPFALNRYEYEFFRPDTSSTDYYARIFAQINIYDSLGLPIDSTNTYFSTVINDTAEARRENYSLFNSLVLAVRPGLYSGRLTVIDAVSKREGEFSFKSIAVGLPEPHHLAIGGLCLAYQAQYVKDIPPTEPGVPRNGYRVLCNPDAMFSTKDTAVFVYAELYNLDFRESTPGRFVLSLASLDTSGNATRVLGTRAKTKTGRSAVIVESFDIGGWPAGSYVLEMKVTDSSAAQEVAQEIPFEIIAPPIIPVTASLDRAAQQVGLDLATQLNLVHYFLTPDERAGLERLSDAGKLSFLSQYWQERDPDSSTAINENFKKTYERYLYANNFFSTDEGKTDGWKTDRGRVLMVYGLWDKLEDHMHPTADYPYQVWWYYNIKDGVVFVFTDDRGFGNFRLVHSTMDGEIYDQDWDDAIRGGFLDNE
ncbi:MAG: GWxTD domain-containing protein [candidate division Zixibacteria bacterium]|nr:GWxTD domain-containing protein [candidate division Zixibacteria bacterium]